MENIKISVKHNDWSEVFDMLVELGAKHKTVKSMYDDVTGWLFVHEGVIWVGVLPHERKECREVTFQQLKDMVVLKRNNVGDANYGHGDYKVLKLDSMDYKIWNVESETWVAHVGSQTDLRRGLKPIEKKEMKEYLIPDNGGYRIAVQDAGLPIATDWIEIPAGANVYAKTPDETQPHFRKISKDGLFLWTLNEWKKSWLGEDACILWQRNKGESMKEFLVKHDDKWTLRLLDSDTQENSYRVAVPKDAIEARLNKSRTINFIRLDGCWMNEKTNGEWFMSMNHSEHEIIWQRSETESLNDQYAEIEQIRQDTVKVTIDELKHHVYKKDVSHLDSIDVYRVLELFNVQSHAVGHAIKKLLCSGGRGTKDEAQDIQEAIDSLIRYQEMKNEDE